MRKVLVWAARGAAGLLALVVVLLVAGAFYQDSAAARNERALPPPGELVDIGERRLHLHCTGENRDGRPTVVLETMSGGLSTYWGWVQPEVATVTRVCSYDRAGRGWSDPAPAPPTLAGTASELHALLQESGESPPYVLVGHSLGGLYVRQFAAAHREEVTGVVLVDSSHPLQLTRIPELAAAGESFGQQLRFFPAMARVGLFQLYFDTGGQLDLAGLPQARIEESAAFLATPEHWRSVAAETRAGAGMMVDAQALGDLGDLPLAVVSAGRGQVDGWAALQADLARLSGDSVHVTVEEATHASLAFEEVHAGRTSAVVVDVVEAARTGRPLAAAAAP